MKRLLAFLFLLVCLVPAALAAEDEAAVAAFAAAHAPGYFALDGLLSEETAILLLETEDGETVFAGCSRTPQGWDVAVSAPLPEGMGNWRILTPDSIMLYWDSPFSGELRFVVSRQADGVWLVDGLRSDQADLAFSSQRVCDEFSVSCCWGDSRSFRDVTQLDWQTFPTTLKAAAAQMDASDWALVCEETTLCDAPDGQAVARYYPGAPLLILERREDWLCVAPAGGPVSGWCRLDTLITGAAQADAKYLTPDDLPLRWYDRSGADVFVSPGGPVLARLEELHPCLYLLGEWHDGWAQVFDYWLPGESGFIPCDLLRPDEYAQGEPRG